MSRANLFNGGTTRGWTPAAVFLNAIGRFEPHGTKASYQRGCPCLRCRQANRAETRDRRMRLGRFGR
jgi:hypothetical protein